MQCARVLLFIYIRARLSAGLLDVASHWQMPSLPQDGFGQLPCTALNLLRSVALKDKPSSLLICHGDAIARQLGMHPSRLSLLSFPLSDRVI